MAPETDLSRDASIQRFEFCFELAWKVIQERARTEGLDCQSPMGCLKLAYTARTYDEVLAKDVYRRLSAHLPLLQALNEYLRNARA